MQNLSKWYHCISFIACAKARWHFKDRCIKGKSGFEGSECLSMSMQ